MATRRRRGYTRKADEDEIRARKPEETCVTGVVGVVHGFYERIDQALREQDRNWTELAREIPCSRQYLEKLTDRDTIPVSMFCRICAVLGIDPGSVLERRDAISA